MTSEQTNALVARVKGFVHARSMQEHWQVLLVVRLPLQPNVQPDKNEYVPFSAFAARTAVVNTCSKQHSHFVGIPGLPQGS